MEELRVGALVNRRVAWSFNGTQSEKLFAYDALDRSIQSTIVRKCLVPKAFAGNLIEFRVTRSAWSNEIGQSSGIYFGDSSLIEIPHYRTHFHTH